MLLMIKNHLNGTWFYELLKCYFRVYSKVTINIHKYNPKNLSPLFFKYFQMFIYYQISISLNW